MTHFILVFKVFDDVRQKYLKKLLAIGMVSLAFHAYHTAYRDFVIYLERNI
jgi:hypothetical protein